MNKLSKSLLFALILFSYYILFAKFFPNINGRLGHDYSYFMPSLIDGAIWMKKSGIFSIPWFTPSFCAGIPKFPNPQDVYLSITQFLTFIINPLLAIKITILLFSSAGFFGFYYILRKHFDLSFWIALCGSTLFLFNGFYLHRMIIGHFGFHSYMLWPWLSYLALNAFRHRFSIFNILIPSLIISYMIHTGISYTIIPTALSAILVVCMTDLPQIKTLRNYSFAIIATTLALSIAKLHAILSLMINLPRELYAIPTLNIIDFFKIIPASLIGLPPQSFLPAVNTFIIERHEFEYGTTIIPALIIVIFVISHINNFKFFLVKKHLPILSILALPILLNINIPVLSNFIQSLPIIKNSSLLLRWFIIYIPFLVIVCALIFNKTIERKKQITVLSLATIVLTVVINFSTDRSFYDDQPFNPQPLLTFYNNDNLADHSINQISIVRSSSPNIAFIKKISPFACYEPIFGYFNESLYKDNIHQGPCLETPNDFLNLKNPACYIFPIENNCRPGDNFLKSQTSAARKFINYQPYEFDIPLNQIFFNWISIISLAISILLLSTKTTLKLMERK